MKQSKWRVQVYEHGQPFRMWFTWGDLETVSNDAQRIVAENWPMCEFSVQRI